MNSSRKITRVIVTVVATVGLVATGITVAESASATSSVTSHDGKRGDSGW